MSGAFVCCVLVWLQKDEKNVCRVFIEAHALPTGCRCVWWCAVLQHTHEKGRSDRRTAMCSVQAFYLFVPINESICNAQKSNFTGSHKTDTDTPQNIIANITTHTQTNGQHIFGTYVESPPYRPDYVPDCKYDPGHPLRWCAPPVIPLWRAATTMRRPAMTNPYGTIRCRWIAYSVGRSNGTPSRRAETARKRKVF